MERTIWTDISNALYEASAQVAEWIKEGGERHDKRIWAAADGIKSYTTAYIAAEKERVKGTEMGERRGTRVYEMLTTRAQELLDGLGMTDAPQPHTYAETAAQTEEDIYTAEDMRREFRESCLMLEAHRRVSREQTERLKQEYKAILELRGKTGPKGSHTYTESTTQTDDGEKIATMGTGFLAGPEVTPEGATAHIYTETGAQMEGALDAMTEDRKWRMDITLIDMLWKKWLGLSSWLRASAGVGIRGMDRADPVVSVESK